jgi:hypothetical protein
MNRNTAASSAKALEVELKWFAGVRILNALEM